MAKKYYAVKVGRKPGIYESWVECKSMVDGFSGARYKGFSTREEAEQFLGSGSHGAGRNTYAFVDGSFNSVLNRYGYGGFLVAGGKRYTLQGYGNDPELVKMHNVAGEILGAAAAMQKAVELGLPCITIYYDYAGIELWATGEWKRNRRGTVAYYEYVQGLKGKLDVQFVKVKGHSGIEGNEEADRLAKQAVGLRIE